MKPLSDVWIEDDDGREGIPVAPTHQRWCAVWNDRRVTLMAAARLVGAVQPVSGQLLLLAVAMRDLLHQYDYDRKDLQAQVDMLKAEVERLKEALAR